MTAPPPGDRPDAPPDRALFIGIIDDLPAVTGWRGDHGAPAAIAIGERVVARDDNLDEFAEN
jgi:hypothetical protein